MLAILATHWAMIFFAISAHRSPMESMNVDANPRAEIRHIDGALQARNVAFTKCLTLSAEGEKQETKDVSSRRCFSRTPEAQGDARECTRSVQCVDAGVRHDVPVEPAQQRRQPDVRRIMDQEFRDALREPDGATHRRRR